MGAISFGVARGFQHTAVEIASQAARGVDNFVAVRQKTVAREKRYGLVGDGASLEDAQVDNDPIGDENKAADKEDELGDVEAESEQE